MPNPILCKIKKRSVLAYIVSMLLFCIIKLFFLGISESLAEDKDGCLICHRYPGLVQIDSSTRFQPLHIDEEKFMQSPHGQGGCRQCHQAVVKVPHTGASQVDCFKECHQEDKEDIQAETNAMKYIHKFEQSYIEQINDASVCGVCHKLYPHSRNNLVRAFINMHTGFLHCEVCHLKRDKFNQLIYDWSEKENTVFHGRPFGTFFNPKSHQGDVATNSISRIDVFSMEKGRKQPVRNPQDLEKAKIFLSVEKQLSKSDRKQKLDEFHKNTGRKEISMACNECHSGKSILDYHQLGFNKEKAGYLKNINIKGLVTKYEVFYFPHLFGN